VKGKKVIVQGWGNVGAAAGYYMAQLGAKVVGIIDRAGGLIREEGFSLEEIREMFINRQGNALNMPGMLSFEEVNNRIWDLGAEVFLPCAASRLVTQDQVSRLHESGTEVIACGANVPFADAQIFYGPIAEFADEHMSVIPDFIANCGMARVFAYLMSNGDIELTDRAIFEDTSGIIREALHQAHQINKSRKGITRTAFEISLKKLV
jgi:glutamate dehydrogenase/leucine dehydrogenase